MADIKKWWADHRPSRRRLIQLYAALLTNPHLKGFGEGQIYTGNLKNLCVPGLNCYSCPGAAGACPLGALQNALASSSKRAPYFVFGIIILMALICGRTICGFLCPFGLIQELIHKIPTPKIRKSRVTHALSYLKYIILIVFVVAIPLQYAGQDLPLPAFCKYICPAGTLEGAIGLLSNAASEAKLSMLNILFTRKFIILALILLGCLFIHRFFCRFLCPLGAIYGCFNKVALCGVKTDRSKCTACGLCVTKCEMDVRHVGDHECIQCGRCIDVCPTKAISWKGGKIFLMPNEVYDKPEQKKSRKVRQIIAWVLALAVLAGVLYYVNKPAPTSDQTTEAVETVAEEVEDDTPIGYNVGERCPDFTVTRYNYCGGGEFTLSQYRGKVVVINFWATWCTPCCAELPYFEQLQANYPDDVQVIAIHSNLVTDDVEDYLDKKCHKLTFALDADGSVISSLGGSTMLPMTVIVDQNGHITYNAVGSMKYDKLESLILPLLNGTETE